MLITALRIHPIAIADPPLRSSYGLHAPYALRTIIELESDEGINQPRRRIRIDDFFKIFRRHGNATWNGVWRLCSDIRLQGSLR